MAAGIVGVQRRLDLERMICGGHPTADKRAAAVAAVQEQLDAIDAVTCAGAGIVGNAIDEHVAERHEVTRVRIAQAEYGCDARDAHRQGLKRGTRRWTRRLRCLGEWNRRGRRTTGRCRRRGWPD